MKTIKIKGWEYTDEDEQKNTYFKDIKIPEGWELWTSEECVKFHNDEKLRKLLKLEDCWFWIQQPFEKNKKHGYVARFGASLGRAFLDCNGNPTNSYSSLGVRFRRKVGK